MIAWLLSVLDTAVVAAGLVAVLGWLLRNWIGVRLAAGIQLDVDKKFAQFKSRIDAAEAQVAAVRLAGLDAAQKMAALALAERVQAVKEIWLGVIDWKAASALSAIISAFDTNMAVGSVSDAGTERTVKTMLDSFQYLELMKRTSALARWRPFVTARGWSLFAAYQGFYAARVTKAALLASRKRDLVKRMWQVDSELQIVRATAPVDMLQAYEAQPVAMGPKFLEYIEVELLSEFQRTLAGEHSGPEASKQAAKVVVAVDSVLLEARSARAEADAS